MNMRHCLIQELYKFKLGHNAAEATKNIYVKSEDIVDHNRVNRWFKEFHLGCKEFDNQTSWDKLKTVDSVAVLQAILANPIIST